MSSSVTDRIHGASMSLAIKAPVRVATTANITLSGEQTIDGVAIVTDDRVLVKNQTTGSENGIYVADTGLWERAPDFDGNRDVAKGTIIPVTDGTSQSNTWWRVTTSNPITIGSSSISFAQGILSDSSVASFIQSGTGAEERTAQDKMRERVSVLDFIDNDTITHASIRAGTNAVDLTTYLQAAHDSLGSNGGVLVFPAGIYLCANLRLTKSDLTIECEGIIKPYAITSTAVIIGKNASGQTTLTRRMKGNLRVSSGSDHTVYTSATGILVEYLIESQLHIAVTGCNRGLSIRPDYSAGSTASNAFVSSNHIVLGDMVNNKIAVDLDPQDASSAVNENHFYGGRFSSSSGLFSTAGFSIRVGAGSGSSPNNNFFHGPCFEDPMQAVYIAASDNHVLDARFEVVITGTRGVDFASKYVELTSAASYSSVTFAYGRDMASETLISHGAGTRVDDFNFTIAGDLREYFYPGALVKATVGGSPVYTRVLSSSYSAPNTSVWVAHGVFTAGSTVTNTPSVSVSASCVAFRIEFNRASVPSVADARSRTQHRVIEMLLRSALHISAFDSDRGGLLLYPGGSASDQVLRVMNFAHLAAFIDGDGRSVMEMLGTKDSPAGTLNTSPATNNAIQTLLANGVVQASADATTPMFVNRKTDDGLLIDFRRDGSTVGNITVAAGTVSLTAFLGTHWAQLEGNAYQPDLPLGTVLEGTEEMCSWNDTGEDDRLCRVRVCETAGSKAVQGTFHRWSIMAEPQPPEPLTPDEDAAFQDAAHALTHAKQVAQYGDQRGAREAAGHVNYHALHRAHQYAKAHDAYENALRDYARVKGCNDLDVAASGRGWIRMAKGQKPQIGDLVEAAGKGCARVQKDDAIRAGTIGRIHGVKPRAVHADGSFTVACGLLLG